MERSELLDVLLQLSCKIDRECRWLARSLETQTRWIVEGKGASPESSQLGELVRPVNESRLARADELRELADAAPPAVAAILYQSARRLWSGENPADAIDEAAALLANAADPPDVEAAIIEEPADGIPAKYREAERPDGKPMRGAWLMERYGLRPDELTRAVERGELTGRKKVGRSYCYKWREIIALAESRNAETDVQS